MIYLTKNQEGKKPWGNRPSNRLVEMSKLLTTAKTKIEYTSAHFRSTQHSASPCDCDTEAVWPFVRNFCLTLSACHSWIMRAVEVRWWYAKRGIVFCVTRFGHFLSVVGGPLEEIPLPLLYEPNGIWYDGTKIHHSFSIFIEILKWQVRQKFAKFQRTHIYTHTHTFTLASVRLQIWYLWTFKKNGTILRFQAKCPEIK